jgi:tetratricopeptide (TPR) repeat protein
MNKGLALMRLGRNDESLACFERALDGFDECESNEDAARALTNCGDLYFRQGRFEEALTALEKSVTLWEAVTAYDVDASKSDHAYSLFSKADMLLHLGRFQQALASSEHCLAIQRAVRGHANGSQQRNDLADALKLHGEILTKLGRVDGAEECLREAAQLKRQAGRPELRGMGTQQYKLFLRFQRGETIYDPSETQVVDGIKSLTLVEGNSYCILERKSGEYVQAMCGVNGFHVEWCLWQDVAAKRYEQYKAGFHEPPGTKESCTKAKYSVPGYSNELLRRPDAKAIFLAFYRSEPRPGQYEWRLMKLDGNQEADLP